MPEKKHLRGVSDKEQRRYEHIEEEAKEPLSRPREEVAAGTVMKQQKQKATAKAGSCP